MGRRFESCRAHHFMNEVLRAGALRISLRLRSGQAPRAPAALTPAQRLKFESCRAHHNGENPSSDGGSGPNGPHISSNIHILERPYTMNVVPDPGPVSYTHLRAHETRHDL